MQTKQLKRQSSNKGFAQGDFQRPILLHGRSYPGSRFGTGIASIGDINHDSYADVAISAPYERDTGVVYIFLGGREGLGKNYAQIIAPENFNVYPNIKNSVKGFGFSISKGVDVDKNTHNGN